MVDLGGDPLTVAMDMTIEAHPVLERMHQLVRSAIDEALEDLPLDPRQPVPAFIGLPQLDRYFGEHDANAVCRRLVTEPGPVPLQPVPIPEGNAAGAVALERALAGLRTGAYTCCVVAGVDCFFDPDRLEALDEGRRIIARDARWGFTPAEGAGAMVVCTATYARNLRLRERAWVGGLATGIEPNHMLGDGICTGESLAQVMRASAVQAGATVTKQYCDMNGERYREHEMSYAILRVPQAAFVSSVDYVAPADAWGNVGAASIPLLAVLPIVAHERGFSPGVWPMVWSGSESGRRGALVLHLPSGGS